ncbi:MAG: hypothetical protein AAF383_09455 [Cyanobacteria bacterium P01_A01_bin.83]
MARIDIAPMTKTELRLMNHLVEESLSQGFQFVSRLVREYNAGLNCFDNPREVLLRHQPKVT